MFAVSQEGDFILEYLLRRALLLEAQLAAAEARIVELEAAAKAAHDAVKPVIEPKLKPKGKP